MREKESERESERERDGGGGGVLQFVRLSVRLNIIIN